VRALESLRALGVPLKGGVELHFTYDEEFGGELGPGWLLKNQLTRPDYLLAAGFSYQVIVAHNGCLQLEVTVHGQMAHAAIPDTGIDALQGAVGILNALYAQNQRYKSITSSVPGITHPYLNVGRIEGGTNTNVVPGKVVLRLDRRMIPEESPAEVEADVRRVIEEAAAAMPGLRIEIKRLLRADSWKPDNRNAPLVQALQKHGAAVFGETIPASGTPLYTDVRLYAAAGIPAAIYGAGPRTVRERQCEARRRASAARRSAARDEGRRPYAARSAVVGGNGVRRNGVRLERAALMSESTRALKSNLTPFLLTCGAQQSPHAKDEKKQVVLSRRFVRLPA